MNYLIISNGFVADHPSKVGQLIRILNYVIHFKKLSAVLEREVMD